MACHSRYQAWVNHRDPDFEIEIDPAQAKWGPGDQSNYLLYVILLISLMRQSSLFYLISFQSFTFGRGFI